MVENWNPELMERVRAACPLGIEVRTLSRGAPNWILGVDRDGVSVHTERSKEKGDPELVEGWMLQTAWDHLQHFGSLTNRYLLDGLGVKRSSAVCAILAQLPDVAAVSNDPITLVLRR
jgi:hypothetical protein